MTASSKKVIWREDEKLQQDITTGSGAVTITFNPGGSAKVMEIRLHCSAASTTAENLVISLDSDEGSAYDVNILTQDMDGVRDVRICDEIKMFDNDKLTIAWTNTDALTWGLEFIYRKYTPTTY